MYSTFCIFVATRLLFGNKYMRFTDYLFVFMGFAVCLCGCQADDEVEPVIVISTSEYTISSATGDEVTATFDINVNWSIVVDYDNISTNWLTVTPDKGHKGDTTNADKKLHVPASSVDAYKNEASWSTPFGDGNNIFTMP